MYIYIVVCCPYAVLLVLSCYYRILSVLLVSALTCDYAAQNTCFIGTIHCCLSNLHLHETTHEY
jgi:hypothetical protein